MSNLSAKENYLKLVLYITVIVLINIAGITLFSRFDLTKNKIYSLSSASRDAVATLSEPLTIKVFFSKNLPVPHNNTERYLRDLLEEYSSKAGKYFNYTFYDVTPEEGGLGQKADENREMANNYGINPVQIKIIENDELKFKNAYMGLVIIHGDLIERIGTITSINGLEYKITTAIRKLNDKVSALLRLDKKIKVNMYFSSSLNTVAPLIGLDHLPLLPEAVKDTIEKLNNKNLGVIDFRRIDISEKEEFDKITKKHNLIVLSWPDFPKKNLSKGYGTAGLVIEFNKKTTTIPLITIVKIPIFGTTYKMAGQEDLEKEINSVMEKMIGINKDIGFLADHGTHSLVPDRLAIMQGKPSEGMEVFNSLLSSRYSIKNINLKETTIPEGLNCLIIARPTEKFSDYELFLIDQALMKGTNIAFISDPFNEIISRQGNMVMSRPRYEPIDTGLEKLLSHYGVNTKKAYVMSKTSYKHNIPQSQGGGEQNIYFAPLLKEDNINNYPVFMKNIKGIITMQIAPLELEEKNIDKNRVKATKLLSSSDQSWLMEDMINLNPMFINPPGSEEEMESYDLAYILEGRFTSYFKGKDIPIKETEEENIEKKKKKAGPDKFTAENKFLEISKPSKIFILACSQMLQDNMLDLEGRSSNATFILNLIDHLNGQDKIAEMRSKQQTLNPLDAVTPFARGFIKIFNIAVLPFLVILFGLGVLVKRNFRKKKISKMFEA